MDSLFLGSSKHSSHFHRSFINGKKKSFYSSIWTMSTDDSIDIGELYHYLPVPVVNGLQRVLEDEFELKYEDIIDDLQECTNADLEHSDLIGKLHEIYHQLSECYLCHNKQQRKINLKSKKHQRAKPNMNVDDDSKCTHINDDTTPKSIEGTIYKNFTQFLNIACIGIYALHPNHITPPKWKKIYANIILHCNGKNGYISPKHFHEFFQYLKNNKYTPRHIIRDEGILYLQRREHGGNSDNLRKMIRSLLYDIEIQISNKNKRRSEEQKYSNDTTLDNLLYNPLYTDFEAALDYCLCYHRLRLHATLTPRFTYDEVNGNETDGDELGLFHYIFESNPYHTPGSIEKSDEHIKILLSTIGNRIEIAASVLARGRLKQYVEDVGDVHVFNKQDRKMKQLLETIYKENITKFRAEYAKKGQVKIDESQFMMVHYVFGVRLLPLTSLLMMIAEANEETKHDDSDSDDTDSGYGMNECCQYYAKPNIDMKVLQCMIYYLLHEFLNNIMGILQGMKRNLKRMPFMLEVEFIFNGKHDLWGDNLIEDNMKRYRSKRKTKTASACTEPEMKQDEGEIAGLIFGIKRLLKLENRKKLQKALKGMDILRLRMYFKGKDIKDIICNIEFLSIFDGEKPPNAMILNQDHPVDMYWPRRSKYRLIDETACKLREILGDSIKDKIEPSHHMGLSITLFGTDKNTLNKDRIMMPMIEEKNDDDIGTKFDRSVMYIFFGGGMVRFFEEDIKDVLPHLFEKDIANDALQDREWKIVRKLVERKERNEYLSDHQFNDLDIVFNAMHQHNK